ncbi:DNA polymerase III subunit gamma and tau [Paractinoplanes brasiliensis]|uniref:DNA polymerase III subunit gamma/tau n=1 Tax=Paractinoplanes brasiliensis TaxID=52695 RepID=A0A4R6JYF8_9ACTN|nr:DNA polymerase III subunit gamma and tau [Actinoplanes brasiliensis]TDO39795.1 DNA polymerase-3 subunit gamma/tau [Actinoplanes brasiliensis]GID31411.1 hypothetical protein Abr02nite_63940 [Actinoplanes brasiliensis]
MALALYRKYRPRTFAEVIGQEHVTEPLSQALRSGRLHHAYLFSGPRGCGKTSSARILARSLNCEQGPTPEPCGVCASCRSLANDGAGSIDVIEIDAASHGGVDDARELREKAFFAPASSRYKIYVIDEAHMVSSAGFNALLKLVEEPPEYVKFIFATTEPEKVLGTIRSRTHHYPFRLIPPAVLRPYLQQLTEAEGVQVEPAVFPLVVRAGGGSARDTLSVLDQLIAGAGPDGVSYARAIALLGVTDVTLIDEMCDAIAAGDGAAAYSTIDRVAEAGHDPRRFASDLLERFRDLIVLQQVPDAVAKGLIDGPADQLEAMGAQAARLGPATLSRCADIVHNGLVDMRGTTAPRLLLELITARMLLPGAEDSTGALLQRLERVERRFALGGEPLTLPEGAPVSAAPSSAALGPSSGGGAPVGSAPVSGAPAVGTPASGADGSAGRSAARAAAMAAARRAGGGGSGGRPAAGQAQASAVGATPAPAASASVAAASSAPDSSAPDSSAPVSAPQAGAAPGSAATAPVSAALGGAASAVSVPSVPDGVVPARGVSAAAASAGSDGTDWNDVADGGAAGGNGNAAAVAEPEYDEPPWDDEPEPDEPQSGAGRPASGPTVQGTPQPAGSRPDEPGRRPVEDAAAGPSESMVGHTPAQPEPAPEPSESAGPVAAAPRRREPAGVLPDAPEEPAAAAMEAAVPGPLTAQAVRQVWGEVLDEVKKQPRGVVLRAMVADATVREVEGQTLFLTVPSSTHAQRISQEPALPNALYEVLGGRWEVRCEVAGPGGGGSASSGPSRSGPSGGGAARGRNQNAPGQRTEGGGRRQNSPTPIRSGAADAAGDRPGAADAAGGRPGAASAGVAPSAAAPAGAAQRATQPAAAGRAPHTQRRQADSPTSAGDDDWPEPVRPGGLSATPVAAIEEDDDEDWPEVRPIPTSPPPRASEPEAPGATRLASDGGIGRVTGEAADSGGSGAAGTAPAASTSGGWSADGGGETEAAFTGGPVGAGASHSADEREPDGVAAGGLSVNSVSGPGYADQGSNEGGGPATSGRVNAPENGIPEISVIDRFDAGSNTDRGAEPDGGMPGPAGDMPGRDGGGPGSGGGASGRGGDTPGSGGGVPGRDGGGPGSGGGASGRGGDTPGSGGGVPGRDGGGPGSGGGAPGRDAGTPGPGGGMPGRDDGRPGSGGGAPGRDGGMPGSGGGVPGRDVGGATATPGVDASTGGAAGGSAAVAAARAAAARAAARAAAAGGGSAASMGGSAGGAVSGTGSASGSAASSGGPAAGRAAGAVRGAGGGLAAARAAAAGARGAAGARQSGKGDAWADGSPTEEAPYDPEFDGPPKARGGYEGFDPGDEPLDDVIDEKTARESSEQQAMRLLQEAFGAEKIGES